MSLKTIIYCFIALKLSCNIQAMEEVRPEEKEKNSYHRILIQNQDNHNRFEKLAWSLNGKFLASYRYIDFKCEIYIWNLNASGKNNSNIAKPHIILMEEKVINLFWSQDNESLIVVLENAVYSYRIFNKNKGKIKTTLMAPSNVNICAACQKHEKTNIALALIDNETNSNYIYLIDPKHETLRKISLQDTSLKNITPIGITWSDSDNKIHVLFANGVMLHINPRDLTTKIDHLNNIEKAPFIPYRFKYLHSLSLEYFDLSHIKHIPNSYHDTIIGNGMHEGFSGIYMLNLNTNKREAITESEENLDSRFSFDVSSNGGLIAYYANQKGTSLLSVVQGPNGFEFREPKVSTIISVVSLDSRKTIKKIEIPSCSMIRDLKISPCSRWIAATTPKGIFVTNLRLLPSLQERKYREMGISKREQARIKRFKNKHKK